MAPRSAHPSLLALAAIAVWSSLAVLSTQLRHVPPFLMVAATLLIGALCGVRGIRLRGLQPRLLALGIYGLFTYHLLLFLALRLAPPVEANLLNYLWPLLMVVLSPLVLPGTRLSGRHLLAAALGFGGAALLVTGGSFAFPAHGVAGHVLAVGAAIVWSTYSLLTRRAGDFPTSTVATFCLVSGLLSLICHALFEPRYHFAASDVPWLIAIGVGPTGAAFFLWDRAVKTGDPRTIGTLAYLTPLLSTLWLALAGVGRLTFVSAIAMAMIICAAMIGSFPSRPQAAP